MDGRWRRRSTIHERQRSWAVARSVQRVRLPDELRVRQAQEVAGGLEGGSAGVPLEQAAAGADPPWIEGTSAGGAGRTDAVCAAHQQYSTIAPITRSCSAAVMWLKNGRRT